MQSDYVAAVTASRALVYTESHGLITNRGAAGTVVLTLPPVANKRMKFTFLRVASQALRVDPDGAEKFLNADGSQSTAGFYKELATDGAELVIQSDGVNWVILYSRGTVSDEV